MADKGNSEGSQNLKNVADVICELLLKRYLSLILQQRSEVCTCTHPPQLNDKAESGLDGGLACQRYVFIPFPYSRLNQPTYVCKLFPYLITASLSFSLI